VLLLQVSDIWTFVASVVDAPVPGALYVMVFTTVVSTMLTPFVGFVTVEDVCLVSKATFGAKILVKLGEVELEVM
jgi:hypothetical protein